MHFVMGEEVCLLGVEPSDMAIYFCNVRGQKGELLNVEKKRKKVYGLC